MVGKWSSPWWVPDQVAAIRSNTRQQLAGILSLADRMHASAVAGEWEEVVRLRGQFHQCCETLFADNLLPEELAGLESGLRRALALNAEVINLCSAARDALGTDLENYRQGQRAISRYSAHAG